MNLQNTLDKFGIKCDINMIISIWNESHRYYHNLNHLNDLIDQINSDKIKYTENEYEKLIVTALFHDIVYDPIRNDNEEKSADFLINCCVNKDNSDILEIKQMIIDTKTHKPSSKISENFIKYDMNIVERDFESLLEWERGIYEEYKSYGNLYKIGRLKFLESLLDKYVHNTENILKLIEYVNRNY